MRQHLAKHGDTDMTMNRPTPDRRLVFGQDRICPRCNGAGEIEVKYRAPGAREATTTKSQCMRCNGTGRID
jgi:DnaJ-class molecular chaperone